MRVYTSGFHTEVWDGGEKWERMSLRKGLSILEKLMAH